MSLTTETILSLTEVLETSINHVLKQDTATLEKFAALRGKVIAFELTDLNLTLYLFPHTEGVQVNTFTKVKQTPLCRATRLRLLICH